MPVTKPTLRFENKLTGIIAGVDEAGIAPLAGPVVAGAVVLDRGNIPEGINDSKKLSAEARERLYGEIQAAAHYGVGLASVEEIGEMNIYYATRLAMVRAVESLKIKADYILVDGVRPPKFHCPAEAIIKGDTLSLSIAAASIIAKVTRDRIMAELHAEFPVYGWDRNKGYPTKSHRDAIQVHGITSHHRRFFGPVREIYEQRELEFA